MKAIFFNTLFFFILSTLSCNSKSNSFEKIALAIGGCNKIKLCPYISMEIDSSLNYKHYCFENCGNTGLFTGNPSKEVRDEILSKINKIKLKNWNFDYEPYRDDEYIKMNIHSNSNIFFIVGHFDDLPTEIQNLVNSIKNIYHNVELLRVTDTNNMSIEIPIPMENYYLLPIPQN